MLDLRLPHIRIKRDDYPPIFIQNGQIMAENGVVYRKDQLPDWWDEELAKLTPYMRVEAGLDPANDTQGFGPAEPSDPAIHRGDFTPSPQRRALEDAVNRNSNGPKVEGEDLPQNAAGAPGAGDNPQPASDEQPGPDIETATTSKRSRKASD
jgi:hypothetical protein